jgi:hypothetical protein
MSNSSGNVESLNSQGKVEWSMTGAQMAQTVGDTQPNVGFAPSPVPQTGGPNMLIVYTPDGLNPTVVVISGATGKVVGRGTAPKSAGQLVGSPSGTEWAWMVDLGTNSTGHDHGEIELAGLGVPVHTLFYWTAPTGYYEQLNYWTDAGIVLQRISSDATCIQNYAFGNATFLINPATGTLTDLFSGSDQFLFVTKEVQIAGFYANSSGLSLKGESYPPQVYNEGGSEIVEGANPSPDGVHVAVNRVGFNGTCEIVVADDYVELINGATQSTLDIGHIWENGWLDNQDFIALTPYPSSIWLYNLQGKPVKLLATSAWSLVGTVSA